MPVSDRTPARLVWVAAIFAGAMLRLFGLRTQIPVDDEWHALHRVVDSSYTEIALSFGFVDHCIPLTLFYKLAADTIGLGDVIFRAPSILAGLGLVVLGPWLMRGRVSPGVQASFAVLLALSPLLIFFSRFARPYALASLLSLIAVDQIARSLSTPSASSARSYGFAAAAAIYVLPPTAPFVLAPALLPILFKGPSSAAPLWHRLRPLAWAIGLAVPFVVPPLVAHPEFVFGKVGAGGLPALSALGRAGGFWIGTQSFVLGLCALGLAGIGARALFQRAPEFAACAAASTLALLIAIFATAPAYSWLGFVLARYALPALPLALLAIALGGAQLLHKLPPPAQIGASVGLAASLLATSGLPEALTNTNAWMANRWVPSREGTRPIPRTIPSFYAKLASEPELSLTLVEVPWLYSLWNNVLPAYEEVHQQRTRIGFSHDLCGPLGWGQYPNDAGIALSAFVPLADTNALAAGDVDYVVLHRDPLAELKTVIDPIDAAATRAPSIEGCAEALLEKGWRRVYGDDAILALAPPK